MDLDLLPFTTSPQESLGPATPPRGDGKTLTLQLAMAAVHSSGDTMSGSATANESLVYGSSNLLSAAVVPAEGKALTITF